MMLHSCQTTMTWLPFSQLHIVSVKLTCIISLTILLITLNFSAGHHHHRERGGGRGGDKDRDHRHERDGKDRGGGRDRDHNRDRKDKHHRTNTGSRSSKRDGPTGGMSREEMEIAEANALRAKLGMAPLQPWSDVVQCSAVVRGHTWMLNPQCNTRHLLHTQTQENINTLSSKQIICKTPQRKDGRHTYTQVGCHSDLWDVTVEPKSQSHPLFCVLNAHIDVANLVLQSVTYMVQAPVVV